MGSWWGDEVKLLEKRRIHEAGKTVLFETGYGPSGLPHLGTFAEVARTAFVQWAFEQTHPGVKTRLIAFSDDMDGLRKVPDNLPNKEMLAEHLGRPLSRIPDPFGKAESFSAYMVGKLKEFVGEMGVEADFLESSTCYADGRFDDALLTLLRKEQAVKDIVLPTLRAQTREHWSPFLPICEDCGRFTTQVTAAHPDAGELSYRCDREFGLARPCGHEGRMAVTSARVKVGWKVDWALRWYVLGVDYEMYGKDLIESAEVSKKICRVLGSKGPVGTFYEMFLDEEGKKISKSIGNGLNLDDWRKWAPDDSILLFLTNKPKKAREIGPGMVPRTIDAFLKGLPQPNEAMSMIRAVTTGADHAHGWSWQSGFVFSELLGLVQALGVSDPEAVFSFLEDSGNLHADDHAYARKLIDYAMAYDRDVFASEREALAPMTLTDGQQSALDWLCEQLEQSAFDEAKALQDLTYEAGRTAELDLRGEWFPVLYRRLISAAKGPRIGTLLSLLGRERSLAKLRG